LRVTPEPSITNPGVRSTFALTTASEPASLAGTGQVGHVLVRIVPRHALWLG
jgi:hypothetical protein